MARYAFKVSDYQADGGFASADYVYEGDVERGWTVTRNGDPLVHLGPGYADLKTRWCGVCSTDLARRFLPFPLPQITGHEVVADYADHPVVVEINASHHARGLDAQGCPWCTQGMHTHCPERVTLGINRLPGGFAPVVLAPRAALLPLPEGVDPLVAVLTEPFAAALHGVRVSAPRSGDRVAVLGPRRLGALTVAALAGYRTRENLDFSITALTRHEPLGELNLALGADQWHNPEDDLGEASFDLVFDTSGTPSGFEVALHLSKRALHLKSTHGQGVMGLQHLSDLVVDELAILPCRPESLEFAWPGEGGRDNPNVFIGPEVSREVMRSIAVLPGYRVHRIKPEIAWGYLQYPGALTEGSPVPRFDLGVAGSLLDLDRIIRPIATAENGLVRAQGAVLLAAEPHNPLTHAICARGVEIHTSRCGPFAPALALLQQQPDLAAVLQERMITHHYPLSQIEEAFAVAGDSRKSIKVVVES